MGLAGPDVRDEALAVIAATAIAHRLPVVTQGDDFDQSASAHAELRVTKV